MPPKAKKNEQLKKERQKIQNFFKSSPKSFDVGKDKANNPIENNKKDGSKQFYVDVLKKKLCAASEVMESNNNVNADSISQAIECNEDSGAVGGTVSTVIAGQIQTRSSKEKSDDYSGSKSQAIECNEDSGAVGKTVSTVIAGQIQTRSSKEKSDDYSGSKSQAIECNEDSGAVGGTVSTVIAGQMKPRAAKKKADDDSDCGRNVCTRAECVEMRCKYNALQRTHAKLAIDNAEINMKFKDLSKTVETFSEEKPDDEAVITTDGLFLDSEIQELNRVSATKRSDSTFLRMCIEFLYQDNLSVL